jgi:hypothetical protein
MIEDTYETRVKKDIQALHKVVKETEQKLSQRIFSKDFANRDLVEKEAETFA